jgi:tetratricopeptide (TPR) repeat protein
MKKLQTLLLASSFIALTANAQITAPQPSPTATLTQTVGLTEVAVSYSRPGVKDRTIFGGLEKWGNMWRTGANASTKVKFSEDVTIEGNKLAAGEYALYTIPGESEWTIIFNTNLTLWGTGGYKEEEDAFRFTVKPVKLADKIESLVIDFSHFTYTGAKMNIKWENTLVSFTVETNSIDQVEKQIKEQLIDGPSAGSYASAAEFYLENDKDLTQALTWMNKAIEKRPEAFWYVHKKAKVLAKMGKKKEAIEAAKKSIEMAKANEGGDYGYVATNEKLIKELEGK